MARLGVSVRSVPEKEPQRLADMDHEYLVSEASHPIMEAFQACRERHRTECPEFESKHEIDYSWLPGAYLEQIGVKEEEIVPRTPLAFFVKSFREKVALKSGLVPTTRSGEPLYDKADVVSEIEKQASEFIKVCQDHGVPALAVFYYRNTEGHLGVSTNKTGGYANFVPGFMLAAESIANGKIDEAIQEAGECMANYMKYADKTNLPTVTEEDIRSGKFSGFAVTPNFDGIESVNPAADDATERLHAALSAMFGETGNPKSD